MTTPKSANAYDHCAAVFDRALQSAVILKYHSLSERESFRGWLNSARVADRKRNMEIYAPGHPMHGKSAWDKLIVSRRQVPDDPNGEFQLRIGRSTIPMNAFDEATGEAIGEEELVG